jgi:heterodisulfide reductase subunit B
MKKILLFRGCTVPVLLSAYEAATNLVLERFGIRVIPMNKANCCGSQYIEALNSKAFLALNGRILALAEAKGMDVLALCGACTTSLKSAKHLLDSDKRAKNEVNSLLKSEGLEYTGDGNVKHLLDLIQEDIGLLVLKKAIINPYSGIRLAVHYGCQAIRPNGALNLKPSDTPKIVENIIKLAGGIPVDYEGIRNWLERSGERRLLILEQQVPRESSQSVHTAQCNLHTRSLTAELRRQRSQL